MAEVEGHTFSTHILNEQKKELYSGFTTSLATVALSRQYYYAGSMTLVFARALIRARAELAACNKTLINKCTAKLDKV